MSAPHSKYPITSLKDLPRIDSTPHIGTEFTSTTQLSSLLASDVLIKELAELVSQRGVVFFKNQDIEIGQQKELARRMGEVTGKPESSGLHVHPITVDAPELGIDVSVISSAGRAVPPHKSLRASIGWHSDITFEKVPSNYAILKMHTLPTVGGDTLWASAYEAYDRLSPAYQRFLEGLTAAHNADFFHDHAKRTNIQIQQNRGSPENVGDDLTAIHPVIRTNPVTGWKGLFVNKTFTQRIVELTQDESDDVLENLFRQVSDNHDLQVRYKWAAGDVAIWDNRSTFHSATNDYEGHRQGNRVVCLGEKPFYDPTSVSRRKALGLGEWVAQPSSK